MSEISDKETPGRAARKAFGACLDGLMTAGIRSSGRSLKWTNEKLAGALNNTPTAVSNWRRGVSLPEERSFERLKAVVGSGEQASDELQRRLTQLTSLWEAASSTSLRGRRAPLTPKHPQLFGVPSELPNFTGREAELTGIETFFKSNPKKPWLVLAGMAGIGKTASAACYFRRGEIPFERVYWCSAETRSGLLASLTEIGHDLGLVRPRDASNVFFAKATLREVATRNWCLVYDNAGLPSEFEDLLPADTTALLITSQTSDWVEWCSQIDVPELPPEDAVRFLQEQGGKDDRQGAQNLAFAVGYLPLALSHAASTCKHSQISFSDYVKELRSRIKTVPPSARYPRHVYATIEMAMNAIPDGEGARLLLYALSFCAPERIPLLLIRQLMEDQIETGATDPLLSLVTFSLLKGDPFDDGTEAFVVHRLVQEVGREIARNKAQCSVMIGRVVGGLRVLFPVSISLHKEAWPRCEQLLPHAIARWNDADDTAEKSDVWLAVATAAATYLHVRGDYASARVMMAIIVHDCDRLLALEDSTRLNALSEYADMLREETNYEDAKRIYRELIPILTRRDGIVDRSVADCLRALGSILNLEGSHEEAASLLEQALAIYEKEKPSYVAGCLAELGWAQLCSIRYSEAEVSLLRSVELVDNDTEAGRLDLAHAYDGLALLNVAQKRSDVGLDFARRAIAITENVLGPGINLCMRLYNLAMLYFPLRMYMEAQRYFEDVLEMVELYVPSGFRRHTRSQIAEHFLNCRDFFRARDIMIRETEDEISENGEHSYMALLGHRNVAGLSIDLEDFEEALRHCAIALSYQDGSPFEHDPVFTEVASLYHRALQLLGRTKEAEEIWTKYHLDTGDFTNRLN